MLHARVASPLACLPAATPPCRGHAPSRGMLHRGGMLHALSMTLLFGTAENLTTVIGRYLTTVAHAAAVLGRNDSELIVALTRRALERDVLANFTSQVWSMRLTLYAAH